MDNEADTEIGVSASEDDLTFTITANTVFEQIVTPTINEVEENNNIENNSNNIFETECIDIIGGRVGKTYQFRLFTTYPLSLSFFITY